MSVSKQLNLDSKLGAAFLGNVAAGILYGITCLQSFVYFKKSHSDPTFLKSLVAFLWFLDSLHMALVTHSLYIYLIKNYMNPRSMLSPNWSILSQVYVTCLSDLIIRGIYAERVWKVSRNTFVVIVIALTSLLTCTTGFAYVCIAFVKRKTFADLRHISFLMYTALGSAVVADILVAASMCISLLKSRTGFRRTDSVLTMLMLYTINSSVLTTVCSIACFLTYTIWPMEFTFIGIYVCLSKLFLNSLLAMLNGRDQLKAMTMERTAASGSIQGSSGFSFRNPISTSTSIYNTSSRHENKEDVALVDHSSEPVAIKVDQQMLIIPGV
ncbi:hypothetical protein CPB83DRAFT_634176 [Crepidotus variabilis]|uniref:DUF6534 domain-containing protein n=1 Tax=Crepidotus variabilis TaxID=179855 RepID=A0A9P6ENX9_9AGAR|nr:hypothetical protein CPB83DRAFT_634176 [Crepidotus variabilis]